MKITTTKTDIAPSILNNVNVSPVGVAFGDHIGIHTPQRSIRRRWSSKCLSSCWLPLSSLVLGIWMCPLMHVQTMDRPCQESDFRRRTWRGWVRNRVSDQMLWHFPLISTSFEFFCIYYLASVWLWFLQFLFVFFSFCFTVEDDQSMEFLLSQRLAFLQTQMRLVCKHQCLNTRNSFNDHARLHRLWNQTLVPALPFTIFDILDKSFWCLSALVSSFVNRIIIIIILSCQLKTNKQTNKKTEKMAIHVFSTYICVSIYFFFIQVPLYYILCKL